MNDDMKYNLFQCVVTGEIAEVIINEIKLKDEYLEFRKRFAESMQTKIKEERGLI